MVSSRLPLKLQLNPRIRDGLPPGSAIPNPDGGEDMPHHTWVSQLFSHLCCATRKPTHFGEMAVEEENPTGEAAPEVLEGRIWVDGCWDFFHHGL